MSYKKAEVEYQTKIERMSTNLSLCFQDIFPTPANIFYEKLLHLNSSGTVLATSQYKDRLFQVWVLQC